MRLENIGLELEGVCIKEGIGRMIFGVEKDCGQGNEEEANGGQPCYAQW